MERRARAGGVKRRSIGVLFVVSAAVAAVGAGAIACISEITENTIRSKAVTDLPCDEEKIKVEPADAGPKSYRAEGCGKKAVYLCKGWDSYSQQPICEEKY
jgi:hypothetical protein